jgi:F0F1-type ATP synthase membrane subunit b/b'
MMSNIYPPVPPTGSAPSAATGESTEFGSASDSSVKDQAANAKDQAANLASGAKEQAANLADGAKEQAANVAGGAKDATKQVAGTAKEEATKVASELKSQAKDLYTQTSGELKEQAGVQQKRVATGLHSVSDELSTMANNADGGIAADLVGQVADRAGSIATYLENRDPGTLLEDVRDFARRKPGTFIGLAAVTGVLVGRLTRSLASSNDDADATTTESAPATAPATPGATTSTTTGAPVGTPATPVVPTGVPTTARHSTFPTDPAVATAGSTSVDADLAAGDTTVGDPLFGGERRP